MARTTTVETRLEKHFLPVRTARAVTYAGFALAAILPAIAWRRPVATIASDFRLDFEYLVTGWTAYTLIVLGLLMFVPVVLSVGRRAGDRFYSRARNAYAGWAISLYVLGVALAAQVAAVTGT